MLNRNVIARIQTDQPDRSKSLSQKRSEILADAQYSWQASRNLKRTLKTPVSGG